ncbi:TonB-dependent receptor [Ferrimonas sp. SCSIO 43195]|uniref:TonB-dependent receptor n=1 Tax=Ferrimonas sp. SCSIO 43195 TaxID=2822844 RepID=UPI002076602A|nr:TonB-dependent receptor [Ferrimonas sp. SCSIO 43195]USD35848.1 TonB-dependent receptor [Ferrimonas sp. SCSIO 43195]
MRTKVSLIALAVSFAVHAQEIETITVNADLRNIELEQLPGSATVVDSQAIKDEGGEHFEQILDSIPNLNWSGATSRPRYFQIRGVGEQEDYKGAPNSSVGFIVDDIDLSGLGMAASLYDLQQVEVLRGPQGTQYGANALAGLIYVKSMDPSDEFESGLTATLAEDNQQTYGGYVSGAATDTLNYRVMVHSNQQDGFRDNLYLGRDDTNARDELTLRTKLLWQPSDRLQAKLTFLHADLDNGYDAWTLDNNGFDTITDNPGEDSQRTNGASLNLNYDINEALALRAITSWSNTHATHAYDGDWANDDYWADRTCYGEPCVYVYNWSKALKRDTLSQELRLSSREAGRIFAGTTDWLVGVYANDLQESNYLAITEAYDASGSYFSDQSSDYDADSQAVFGQLDSSLGRWTLSAGLRLEQRDASYRDSKGEAFDTDESMWGGHLSASYQFNADHNGYVRVARGYKAGGFNMGLPEFLSDKTQYDTETLYNYEIGLKSRWLDGALTSALALFYMDRQDQQVEASVQEPGSGDFVLYTSNATDSNNYGAELELNYQVTESLQLHGSVGWLETEYGDYVLQLGEDSFRDLSGRELAHAPNYQFAVGATYRHDQGWFANVNLSGKDEFYYSDSNDSVSAPYQVLDAKIGYEANSWSLYLWGRNLTDEKYGVRGFYFGNEPDQDWADKQYIRYGDPQQFGVTFNYDYF